MALFAYLKVSTDTQDVNMQKLGVLEYCANRKLGVPELVEDTVSSKVDWRQREIGVLLGSCVAGDVIVVSELSCLARSTLQVLEIMQAAANAQVAIHVVKSAMVMDGALQSKIYATIFGLAAEIERDFIVQRTKGGLARVCAEGVHIGRPPGEAKTLALDVHAKKIDHYLELNLNKRTMAKLLDVSPNTLYQWLRRRRPEVLSRD